MNIKQKIENHPLAFILSVIVATASIVWAISSNGQVSPRSFALEQKEKAISDLRRELESVTKKLEISETDRIRAEALVKELRTKNQVPADYGPDVWIYRSFLVNKTNGAKLKSCLFDDCFIADVSKVYTYEQDKAKGKQPCVSVMVEYPKPLYSDGSLKGMGIQPVILTPGYSASVIRPDYDYKVLVESVGFEEVRLGIGIRSGTFKSPGGKRGFEMKWNPN